MLNIFRNILIFLFLLSSLLLKAVDKTPISIYSDPVISISATDTIICPYDSISVTVEISGAQLGFFRYKINNWTYAQNIINGTGTITKQEAGTYTIYEYGVYEEGIPVIYPTNFIFNVSHYDIPTALLTGGGDFCEGDEIEPLAINFTGEAPWTLTYIPNNRAAQTATYENNYEVLADLQNTAIQLRIISDKNCAAQVRGNGFLSIWDKPEAIINGDTVFCADDKAVFLTNRDGNYKYLWSIPDGASALSTSNLEAYFIGVQWTKPGLYLINLSLETINSGCKSELLTQKILVHEFPEVKSNFDTNVCFSGIEPVTLNPSIEENNTVFWPAFNYTGNDFEIYEEGTYAYTETIPFGCAKNGSIVVSEKCIPELFVPEAFTPNNDGVNDNLDIYGIYFNLLMRIYSQNGELVYTHNNSMPWNGDVNGTSAPNGVYFWKAEFTDKVGEPYSSEGQFTLIR